MSDTTARASTERLAALDAWLQESGALDIAEELPRLEPPERGLVMRLLARDRALAVFEALDPTHQQEVLEGLRDERFAQLIEDLDPDDRARLLHELPAKVTHRALAGLSIAERSYTAALLGYPDESAGRVMTPEFVSLRGSMTVADAFAKIRRTNVEEETLHNLAVTDDERHLMGMVDLPTLVRARPDARISDLMSEDFPSVRAMEDREIAARLIRDSNVASLPVVDSEDRLVGVVTVDDAMWVLAQEETEDALASAATKPLGRPYLSVSIGRLAARRATWLLILVVGASLTVGVLDRYELTLAEQVTLALFIPLLIGTGGNTGAQATTVVIRAMSMGEVRFSDLPVVVWREARVGVLLGGLLSAMAFLPVGLLYDWQLAGVVSLTLLAICTWATFAGSLLPMVADRAGVDPAVVSAPLITTLVDATGLVIYFAIARLMFSV